MRTRNWFLFSLGLLWGGCCLAGLARAAEGDAAKSPIEQALETSQQTGMPILAVAGRKT